MMLQTTKCPISANRAGQALRAAVCMVLLAAMAGTSRAQGDPGWGFDLEHPDAVFELPGELEEISALSLGPDGMLLAVQDEEGYIFRLDPDTGSVVRRDRFAGDGDYEGIEWVGEWIYVLESSGHFYRTPAGNPSRDTTVRIRLDLPGGCNAEGLAWDDARQRFLVSCKDADGVRGRKGRSVFSFLENGGLEGRDLFFQDSHFEQANVDGVAGFRTSAVAVHPVSGRIFLLSSDNPHLCRVEVEGLSCLPLPLTTMRQPEGLAFDGHGALWISSEARGHEPTLHRFDPIGDH